MYLPKRHIRIDNGDRKSITVYVIFLKLSILFNLVSRSYGNMYFQVNPLLEGSVSVGCSLDTCRSILEAAAECNKVSICQAIATQGSREKQCLSCSCPADGVALNKDGIFYIRDVEPYLKGECYVFCYFVKLCLKYMHNRKYISRKH